MSLLYIDLETSAYVDIIQEEDYLEFVPRNYKKDESIKKFIDDNKPELSKKIIKTRSLDPLQCKVICISYSFNGQKPQAITGKEETILEILQTKIQDYIKEEGGSITGLSLVGHNIKKFDAPILYLRACKYDLDPLKQLLYFTRRDIIDTMEMGSYYVYGHMVSLDSLCKFFRVESPKSKMDGSMVYDFYKQGRIEDIAKYCNEDVQALIDIYKKLSL